MSEFEGYSIDCACVCMCVFGCYCKRDREPKCEVVFGRWNQSANGDGHTASPCVFFEFCLSAWVCSTQLLTRRGFLHLHGASSVLHRRFRPFPCLLLLPAQNYAHE